ncbi:MAG TPA: HD-GYP domain-containing protein [Gemmatimonadales bacterium]|nr:HD-GYP domain-containing protein [Gemmatimonadales bacterium]
MSAAMSPIPVADAQQEADLRRAGRQLISAIYGAMRAIKLYPLENQAVVKALAELESVSGTLVHGEGELELRASGEYLFVNGVRLRLELDNYASFGHVIARFDMHDVGALLIRGAPGQREWLMLLAGLQADRSEDDAPGDTVVDIHEKLDAAGITCFELHATPQNEAKDEQSSRAEAKRTYAHGVAVARDVITSVRMGRAAGTKRLKRAVQTIVDQLLGDEASLVGLTTLRDYDDYTFTHCVNVCIFSVALGKRLGLSKVQLYDLGMGAVLHDIGKSRLPSALINKAEALTREEWALIAAHPWLGMLAMFNLRTHQDLPYRSMLVAYEHHMKRDLSGYPRSLRPRVQTLFSRIVAVADSFDAATSKRSYQSTPWTPAEVMREMRDNSSRGLDPVIVKAFINVLGIFPVGTLVVLDSFELGLVHSANPDVEEIARPVVRIVSDANGNLLFPGELVDLAARNADGGYVRTIVKTTDPQEYGIRVGDYFV